MMDSDILINGEHGAHLAPRERGLHYGDGLFETVAVYRGRALWWAEHRARLAEGCTRLGIPMPPAGVLDAEVGALSAGYARAVVKVIVTRGSGGRGYAPPHESEPTRLVMRYPWPEYPQDWPEAGVRVRLCATRLACNPVLAGLKHLNRLEQVLARAEWRDPQIAEGLMCDLRDRVVEGTMSNVFCVRDGILRTPKLSVCGVAGIMRAELLRMAREAGLMVEETDLSVAELSAADEVFLSNSVIGLWPVRELEGRSLAMGPVSRVLRQQLAAASEGCWARLGDASGRK